MFSSYTQKNNFTFEKFRKLAIKKIKKCNVLYLRCLLSHYLFSKNIKNSHCLLFTFFILWKIQKRFFMCLISFIFYAFKNSKNLHNIQKYLMLIQKAEIPKSSLNNKNSCFRGNCICVTYRTLCHAIYHQVIYRECYDFERASFTLRC